MVFIGEENLELFVQDKMLSLVRGYFPPFLVAEIKEWMSSKEVHEILLLLSECLLNDSSPFPLSTQEKINQLAVNSPVSMVLAIMDRYYIHPRYPQLDLLSILHGRARHQFISSLSYILSTSFQWNPTSHLSASWGFFKESFAYFMSEQVTPRLLELDPR